MPYDTPKPDDTGQPGEFSRKVREEHEEVLKRSLSPINYHMVESEDMSRILPSEIALQKAQAYLLEANEMVKRLAWVIAEVRRTHSLFHVLLEVEKKWGKDAAGKIKQLVDEVGTV